MCDLLGEKYDRFASEKRTPPIRRCTSGLAVDIKKKKDQTRCSGTIDIVGWFTFWGKVNFKVRKIPNCRCSRENRALRLVFLSVSLADAHPLITTPEGPPSFDEDPTLGNLCLEVKWSNGRSARTRPATRKQTSRVQNVSGSRRNVGGGAAAPSLLWSINLYCMCINYFPGQPGTRPTFPFAPWCKTYDVVETECLFCVRINSSLWWRLKSFVFD